MKKSNWLLSTIILAMLFFAISCQYQKQDTEAEKATLNELFDKFNSAFNANDAEILASYLTEDVLGCGTDPSEFFNKQEMTDLWTQSFDKSDPEITIIGERMIKVAPDGNSASVVDQFMMPMYTPKIPWRNVYHTVKINGEWKIIFFSMSFIPKNEDVAKLNAALD